MSNRIDTARFMDNLSIFEQMVVFECALAALRDELDEGYLRFHGVLDLDLSDLTLKPLLEKLSKFMESE